MHRSFLKTLALAIVSALAIALLPEAHAQGVVSSGITGTVLDDAGNPVAGVTVTATHVPTNSAATAVTGSNGRFRFSGLRPGGPYSVTGTGAGITVAPVTDLMTALGEDSDVTLRAKSEVVVLEKFVATASRNDLDSNATGAGSVLSNRGVLNQPTSNRSFADMMKTNPFVTIRNFPQVTALGMNNRYNSISLDGARLNDQFGLAGSGLFSLKNPFSLDAVENFSIALTPYDVTQSGFAGATINVVSKSGTNEFHGSTYYIYTSSKWQGPDVSGTTNGKRSSTFFERTYGATLGGPIWKNHLFFFLNWEKYKSPGSGPTNAGFNPDTGALSNVDAQVKALPGSPDLGTFGQGAPNLVTDEKKLAKVDWQITKDHRLTVRYSRTEGSQPFSPNFRTTGLSTPLPSVSPTPSYVNGITSYNSNFYSLAVDEKVWATQLFSNWSSNLKTEISYSKNDTTSLRSTPVNFPEIVILGVPGTSTTGAAISTNDALVLGTDVSSMGNGVISKEYSYGGNATYDWRDFTFKAGLDYEKTDFENLFRSGSYGVFMYNYSPTLNLANDKPLGFVRGVASSGYPGTDISSLNQTGYYLQGKWERDQRLSITFGVRFDDVGSPIAPPTNAAFSTAFNPYYAGIRNDGTIDGTSRLAPRVSFNYAVDPDRKIQVRGGLGIFLGRNPWVWISNSYGNAGFGRFTLTRPSATSPTLGQYLAGSFTENDPAFKFDPANPLGTTNLSPTSSSSVSVNFIQPGLQLPTNMRGNLAADFRLPRLNAVFSVEWIHTKVLEAMFYDNLNLKVLNADAQNNPTLSSYGADGRLRFSGSTKLVSGWGDVLRLRNVSTGRSDYVALALDRPFKDGWAYNLTYTRGSATEAQPAGSSTAGSQWNFNVVFNQNRVEETRSDYEVRDRIQASVSKEFNFLKRAKTTVTLYYEGHTGLPFSYIYSNDLNGDGRSGQDTLAVPTDANDARFSFASMTSAQQNAYFAFLNSSGLSKYAGGYAPRNAFFAPWQNRLDLHVSQQVKVAGPVEVELFADFINFGSWMNKKWFNYVETLGSPSNSNQNRVLGSATYNADGKLVPTISLNPDGSVVLPAASQFLPSNSDARWRIQGGARIRF